MRISAEKVNGKYSIKLCYKDSVTGKNKRKKIDSAETREQADALANMYRLRIEYGEDLLGEQKESKITFGECIVNGMKKEYGRKEKKSGNTYLAYTNLYEKHIKDDIGCIPVKDIDTWYLQDFLDKKAETYSKSTVNSLKSLLKKGVNYALLKRYIKYDITSGLKIGGKDSKSNSQINVLTVSELKGILTDTKGTELGLEILLGSSYGLRLSEILGLTWDNIDFDNKKIIISQIVARNKNGKFVIQEYTKNKRALVLDMTEQIEIELKNYKVQWNKRMLSLIGTNKGNLLFCNNDFTPISVSVFSNQFKKFMKSKGFEHITFHGLRHSYATMLFEMGCSLGTIGQMLNHKDPNLALRTYVHLTDSTKSEISKNVSDVLNVK